MNKCPKCQEQIGSMSMHYCPTKPANESQREDERPLDAAACPPQKLAQKIAAELFQSAFGDSGTRLEIKRAIRMPFGPEQEVLIGGWCLEAAVDHIAKVIEESAKAIHGEPKQNDHE